MHYLSAQMFVWRNAFTLSHWNFIISTSFQWLDITARFSSRRLYAIFSLFLSRSDSLSHTHSSLMRTCIGWNRLNQTKWTNETAVNQIMHSIPFLSLIPSNHAHQCVHCTHWLFDIQFICLHIKLHFHAFIQCNGPWLFIDVEIERQPMWWQRTSALLNENVGRLLGIGALTQSTGNHWNSNWKKKTMRQWIRLEWGKPNQTIQSNYAHMQCVTLHVCEFNHKIALLHITFFCRSVSVSVAPVSPLHWCCCDFWAGMTETSTSHSAIMNAVRAK